MGCRPRIRYDQIAIGRDVEIPVKRNHVLLGFGRRQAGRVARYHSPLPSVLGPHLEHDQRSLGGLAVDHVVGHKFCPNVGRSAVNSHDLVRSVAEVRPALDERSDAFLLVLALAGRVAVNRSSERSSPSFAASPALAAWLNAATAAATAFSSAGLWSEAHAGDASSKLSETSSRFFICSIQ